MYRLSKLKSKYIAAFFLFILLVFLPFKDTIRNIFVFFSHKPFFLAKNKYQDKIAELQSRNLTLQLELDKFKPLKEENDKLRKAFDFKTKERVSLIGAQVIAFTPSAWHRSALINKGKDQGIKKGMFAIDESGNLLGKIIEANNNFSRLIFIDDPNFNVSVFIGDESLGLLKGALAGAKILYIEDGEKIEVGDKVKVKIPGLNPSLAIGRIKRVKKNTSDLFWNVDVNLVIKNTFFDRVFIVK